MLSEFPQIMRPIEASAFLRMSVQRLAKLRLEGGGPAFVKAGHTILYRVEDLQEWLAANRRRTVKAAPETLFEWADAREGPALPFLARVLVQRFGLSPRRAVLIANSVRLAATRCTRTR